MVEYAYVGTILGGETLPCEGWPAYFVDCRAYQPENGMIDTALGLKWKLLDKSNFPLAHMKITDRCGFEMVSPDYAEGRRIGSYINDLTPGHYGWVRLEPMAEKDNL